MAKSVIFQGLFRNTRSSDSGPLGWSSFKPVRVHAENSFRELNNPYDTPKPISRNVNGQIQSTSFKFDKMCKIWSICSFSLLFVSWFLPWEKDGPTKFYVKFYLLHAIFNLYFEQSVWQIFAIFDSNSWGILLWPSPWIVWYAEVAEWNFHSYTIKLSPWKDSMTIWRLNCLSLYIFKKLNILFSFSFIQYPSYSIALCVEIGL